VVERCLEAHRQPGDHRLDISVAVDFIRLVVTAVTAQ